MPPKPGAKPGGKKKKKKTKEELEQERLQAEEAARLAEEERLRLEELERQRLEALENSRQELVAVLVAEEDAQLQAERTELEPLLSQFDHERLQAAAAVSEEWEWERFLLCTAVPHPRDRVAMNSFVTQMQESSPPDLAEALRVCSDCHAMILESKQFMQMAHQRGDQASAGMHQKDTAALFNIITTQMDRVTASILHHADEHANDRGEVQLGIGHELFLWGIWINTSKNPRLKSVEMPQINMVVEIPKTIALANITLRVQHRSMDEYYDDAQSGHMAVGGILYVDLLVIPPAARKVKSWVLRQVTALATTVGRMPYPIPPAGADPLTYRGDEEPPPLGFTYPFKPNILLLDDDITVGWWDASVQAWSTEGVTDAAMDKTSGTVTFRTTHLAPLAVLQSRARLLPYRSWSVRPTGGRNGSTAEVTLDCGLEAPIVFEVSPGMAQLVSPQWPALCSLAGKSMPPSTLLLHLLHHGLPLLPRDRDAAVAGVALKEWAAEEAMCNDLALICGAFLVSSSKWNQTGALADECLCRVSEVCDWEEGGRTELAHLQRIFEKEKEDGERRVLAIIRRGARGVAFSDALNKREAYPDLVRHETVESVQQCSTTIYGQVHASLLTLLKGTPGPLKETPTAIRLQASPESLELVRNTNALFTNSLAQLLFALRVFSFG